jgi:DNA-binding HxlR family transcriptional regulator
MTKREMFTVIRNYINGSTDGINVDEINAFIDNEIMLLNKKSSREKKPTARQVENEAYKAEILDFLRTADAPKSIKNLQAEIPSLAPETGMTNQRITHMLTDLVKTGQIVRELVKKVPYFSIADDAVDTDIE